MVKKINWGSLNSEAKRSAARKKTIVERHQRAQAMRYSPKERSTYRKALRFGRSLKADGKYRTAPRLRFNGGRLAVMRDQRGNVHIAGNSKEYGNVSMLGPRGSKGEFSAMMYKGAGARTAGKILSIVGKGVYKHGSTGNAGG